MATFNPITQSLYNYTPSMILETLNAANKTEFTKDQFIFDLPKKADATWVQEKGNGNTILNLSAVEGKGLEGRCLVTYDRMDIADLCTLFGKEIYLPNTLTKSTEVLPWILKRFGIVLYDTDFVPADIEWDAEKEHGTVTLKAVENSYVYTGTVVLKTHRSTLMLSDVLPQELKSYAADTYRTTSCKPAADILYGVDFTNSFSTINALKAGDLTKEEFDTIIKSNVELPDDIMHALINNDGSEGIKFNFTGAKIEYVGLCSGVDFARAGFKYVLVLSFPDGEGATYCGNMFIHYNEQTITDLVVAK